MSPFQAKRSEESNKPSAYNGFSLASANRVILPMKLQNTAQLMPNSLWTVNEVLARRRYRP
jgi:hypothetical protein